MLSKGKTQGEPAPNCSGTGQVCVKHCSGLGLPSTRKILEQQHRQPLEWIWAGAHGGQGKTEGQSLQKRRQRRDLTAAFSDSTKGCKEDEARPSEAETRLNAHGKFQLDTRRTFSTMWEVSQVQEGGLRKVQGSTSSEAATTCLRD